MKFNLSRCILALSVVLAVYSFASSESAAQSDIGQSWFDGGSYNSQSEVNAMYDSNAQGPLGGLFAPNFTRTLTVLGGFNFLSAGTSDELAFREPGIASSTNGALQDITFLPARPPREVDRDGYAISFAFGRRHSRRLRSEIEVAFRSNDSDQLVGFRSPVFSFEGNLVSPGSPGTLTQDGRVDVTSLMKNFIIEFENNSRFTPYAGAGLGLSYVDVEFGEASSDDGEATFRDGQGAFSYQAIGGVATRLNSFADFIVEYRFLGTSAIEFDGLNQSVNYNASTLFLGVKFEY